MPLTPGTKLGPYEIVEPIGKGGMGEVYRARDTKLDRDVAIKVLPEEFAKDEERLARFEREARVVASLNHPNLAAIHGLEESGGVHFLVLELVPGETLAERIARGPLPFEEALPLFGQIAEAVEAAHDKGIIHRDLKPANIKITPEGKIKVLDFGLAKPFDAEPTPAQDLSHSPTLTRRTETGVILGTASYMSPEQARGQVVDKKTDIWAFGCVLFEALTGRVAFPGETLSDTLANVLAREPAWERLPESAPASTRRLLRRCLQKDPSRRLRDIGDAHLELEEALDGAAEDVSVPKGVARWQRALPWVFVGFLTVLALWLVPRDVENPQVVRTSIVLPRYDNVGSLLISPDGTRIVYETDDGVSQLSLRHLDQDESTPIPGSEGARYPFFSPDGEWVGFFTPEEQLKKVRLDGVGAVVLGDAEARGGSWGPGGNIVFSQTPRSGLMKVSADGGTPEPLTTLDLDKNEQSHRWPHVLPNGKAVLFTAYSGGSYDDASIFAVSLSTGERRFVTQGTDARYVSTGHLVYGRGGKLYAVPFDPDRMEVRGNGVPVQVGVRGSGRYSFATSETGTLVYMPTRVTDRRVVLVDLEGRAEPLAAPPLPYSDARFSPDGEQLALCTEDGQVHLYELEYERFSPLFSSFEDDAGKLWTSDDYALWSPDGNRIAVGASAAGTGLGPELFVMPVGERGALEPVASSPAPQWPLGWSPDGKRLLYVEMEIDSSALHIWEIPLGREGDPRHMAQGTSGVFSPDGLWLAYTSGGFGLFEVYVKPYGSAGPGRQVSVDGGWAPIWAPDGRTLYYYDGKKMMAVEIETVPTLAAGTPQLLFEGSHSSFGEGGMRRTHDLSPDGQRFVMIQDAEPSTVTQIHVVQNWIEELKRLVPIE